MKKLFIISLISIITLGCEKIVEDLNQNPNNPTSAPYQYTLTAAEVANTVIHTGSTARRAGILAGQGTGLDRQHLTYTAHTVTTGTFTSMWSRTFRTVLRNILIAKESVIAEGGDGVTLGITKVIQALALGTATSLYGDIPFDQAGSLEFENPEFEKQSVVYGKVQSLLDEAIVNLSKGVGRPPAGAEIHFDGDSGSWIQVANTLKARYYMHTKNYSSAYTAAKNGISSYSNNMMTTHGNATADANLNYQFFALASRKNDLVTSDFFASLIDPDNSSNPIASNYRGHSKTDETARHNYLLQNTSLGIQPNCGNDGFAQIDAPGKIVTFAENHLILAEAGARTSFNTGLTHLNEFRNYMASGGYMTNPNMSDVKYDEFVASDFENGGIENLDGISSNNALIREILEERYISLFGQIEIFNDLRRTQDETAVRVPVIPSTGSLLPQRFIYSSEEDDSNSNFPTTIPGFYDRTEVNE
jgi:hypothetical protein